MPVPVATAVPLVPAPPVCVTVGVAAVPVAAVPVASPVVACGKTTRE